MLRRHTRRMSLMSLILFANPAVALATIPRDPPKFAIEWLLSHPTDSVCEAFDRRYGNGAAARYLGKPVRK